MGGAQPSPFVASFAACVGRTHGGSLAGDALAFLAAALWAATTIVIKATPLRRIDPIKILLYQIGFAALATPPLRPMRSAKRRRRIFGDDRSLRCSGKASSWQGSATRYGSGRSRATPWPQLSAFTFITPLVGVLRRLARVRRDAELAGFSLGDRCWSSPGLALVNWPRGAHTA